MTMPIDKRCIQKNLLFIIIVIQPFLDMLAYFQDGRTVSWAGYIRLGLTFFVPIYSFIITKKKKKFVMIMGLIVAFAILHILNGFRVGYINIYEDVKYMLLVAHMPVLLISFLFIYNKEELKKQVLCSLKVNTSIFLIVFLISYVLKSGNYTYITEQVGWTGWFLIPNAQSIILVSLLPFVVYFILNKFETMFWVPMLGIIVFYIMNGTKTACYSVILVFGGYIFYYILCFVLKKDNKFPLYKVVMLLILVFVSYFAQRYSPRGVIDEYADWVREEEQQKLEQLSGVHVENTETEIGTEIETEIETEIREENERTEEQEYILTQINENLLKRFGPERVLNAYGENVTSIELADMRLKKRIYASLVWEEEDFLTKLVGFEYSKMQYNGDNFDLENDPPAIYYYYGYIGVILYVVLIGYFIIRLISQLIKNFRGCLTILNMAILETLLLQVVMAAYSGYLLRRPNVSIYMMITLLLIYCNTENILKENNHNETFNYSSSL